MRVKRGVLGKLNERRSREKTAPHFRSSSPVIKIVKVACDANEPNPVVPRETSISRLGIGGEGRVGFLVVTFLRG